MGVNYQLLMERALGALEGRRPRLLMHCCCAPCASAALERLDPFFDMTALYYNPNIAPADEHARRLAELQRLVSEMSFSQSVPVLSPAYAPQAFLDAVRGLEKEPEGGARCEACFRLRLAETANIAREQGFEYVATSLTIGPMKRAETVNRIGEAVCAEYGVSCLAIRKADCGSADGLRHPFADKQSVLWLPADFKKKDGYRRSLELSARHGLYRQNYCGCAFSRPNVNQQADNG